MIVALKVGAIMFVVIFTAQIAELDAEYSSTADNLRKRALEQFNCIDFISTSEGDTEIALSYWFSLDDIKAWRDDAEHTAARKKSYGRWYSKVDIKIAEIERHYEMVF